MTVEPRQWAIRLPYTRPPLTLNDRLHWAAKARIAKRLRADTAILARVARVPRLDRIAVTLHYQPRVTRHIDGDNLLATVKPCVDGLRDAGVVPDDDHRHVVHLPVVIQPREPGQRHGHLYLVVRDLGEAMP